MEVRRIPRMIYDGDVEAASYMAREGMQQLNILKSLMGFNNLQQDIRKVEYIDGSRIVCRSCFGEDVVYLYAKKKEEEAEEEVKLYVYVTISDYVTIWDLETGEIAEDVYNNEGNIITFPCHKDKLAKWLEGIKDRPTRQFPDIGDNHKDIGSENRVEIITDEEKYGYFGVKPLCTFDNTVRDEFINTCPPPPWPGGADCEQYNLFEQDTPSEDYIINCDPELCKDSFHCKVSGNKFAVTVYYYRNNNIDYLEPYYPQTKHLYLCSYPSGDITSPQCSSYINPTDMKSYCLNFKCTDVKRGALEEVLELFERRGSTYSFSTDLGDLIVDYIPKRLLPSDYISLREKARQGFDFKNDCYALQIREGCCRTFQHSTWDSGLLNCSILSRSVLDRFGSESNRFAISWCGSLLPQTEKKNWYRVMLMFYMGGFHTKGHSCSTYCSEGGNEFDCPTAAECEEWNKNPNCECEATEIPEELVERFSSVQATIELEHPENYSKENTPVPENPDWGKRYKRPEDYSGLCAFPDRDCGYPEGSGNTCYPFDGTYDIYTLGEAVEELINSHYEDGSDDQLLVYLYKREVREIKYG